jgi:hypothetical protein
MIKSHLCTIRDRYTISNERIDRRRRKATIFRTTPIRTTRTEQQKPIDQRSAPQSTHSRARQPHPAPVLDGKWRHLPPIHALTVLARRRSQTTVINEIPQEAFQYPYRRVHLVKQNEPELQAAHVLH